MLKKSMFAVAAIVIALTGLQAEAMAGPKKKKFVRHLIKHHLLHHNHRHHYRAPVYVYSSGGSCWRYKRNYLATGSFYWAEKWRVCQLVN